MRLQCTVPTSEKFTVQLSAFYFTHVVIRQCAVVTKVVTACNNGVGQFKPMFQVEGNTFRPIFFGYFTADWLLYNFVAGSFHTKTSQQTLFDWNWILIRKTQKSVLSHPCIVCNTARRCGGKVDRSRLILRKRPYSLQSHPGSSNLSPNYRLCDLLLVVDIHLGRISHGFGATATYWSKIVSGTYPCLIQRPHEGWQLANMLMNRISQN